MKAENKAYIITTTQKENQTFPMVNFIGNMSYYRKSVHHFNLKK